jgi:hypothetical protein
MQHITKAIATKVHYDFSQLLVDCLNKTEAVEIVKKIDTSFSPVQIIACLYDNKLLSKTEINVFEDDMITRLNSHYLTMYFDKKMERSIGPNQNFNSLVNHVKSEICDFAEGSSKDEAFALIAKHGPYFSPVEVVAGLFVDNLLSELDDKFINNLSDRFNAHCIKQHFA